MERKLIKRPFLTKKGVLALLAALALALGLLCLLTRPRALVPLEAEEIQAALLRNEEVGAPEQTLVDSALSLVGRVHYFWGGKSAAIGFDPSWGQPTEVKSEGSESTGTLRPLGLDCSGFVSWAFLQLGYTPAEVEELIGNGTYNQWYKSQEIEWRDLRVGDIAFQNAYPTNKGNHIGICIGFTKGGKPLFVHCAASFDNVVVTQAGDVFHYARRPSVFLDGE